MYVTSVKGDNHPPKHTGQSMGKHRSSGLAVTNATAGSTYAVLNWMMK